MKRFSSFLCALFLFTIPSRAVDMFLKVAGVAGDSQVVGHVDEIVLDSYSLGMNTVYSTSGGITTGKLFFHEFQFTKHTDRSSTALMLSVANGRSITDVTLSLVRPSGDQGFLFMKVTLFNPIVTSFTTSASAADNAPIENISMTFRKIRVENFKQNPDGSTTTSTFSWDLATGGGF